MEKIPARVGGARVADRERVRAEAVQAMNDVCDGLEQKLYGVIEDALFEFTRRV